MTHTYTYISRYNTHYLPMIFGNTVLAECSPFSFELDDVASPLLLAAGAGGSWRGFLPDVTFGGGAGGGSRPDVLVAWLPWLRLCVPTSPGCFGSFRRSQPCLRACGGVMRTEGSHSRQRWRKSRKSGSSQPFSARLSSLLPGGPRYFPLLDRPPA